MNVVHVTLSFICILLGVGQQGFDAGREAPVVVESEGIATEELDPVSTRRRRQDLSIQPIGGSPVGIASP